MAATVYKRDNRGADILVLGPQLTQRITEKAFEFVFILTGKLTMAFITGRSWQALKSWHTCGDLDKDLGAVSQTELSRSLVSSATQAYTPVSSRTSHSFENNQKKVRSCLPNRLGVCFERH